MYVNAKIIPLLSLYNCDEQVLRYGSLCEPMSGHSVEALRNSGLKRLTCSIITSGYGLPIYQPTHVSELNAYLPRF